MISETRIYSNAAFKAKGVRYQENVKGLPYFCTGAKLSKLAVSESFRESSQEGSGVKEKDDQKASARVALFDMDASRGEYRYRVGGTLSFQRLMLFLR